MPNRFSAVSTRAGLLVCGCLLLPVPAFAGFQWVAPNDAPTAPVIISGAPSQAPVATTAPEVISPVIIGGSVAPPGSVPAPVISPEERREILSVGPTPSAVMAEASQPPSVAADSTASPSIATLSVAPPSDVVHGFAKQVPLAVALRQILPQGYGFSVDPDVDLGVLVSFQGGKPWRDTLRDALDVDGLVMREQGQMVSVGHPAVVAMPAPAIPAPIPAAAPAPSMPRTADVNPSPVVAQGSGMVEAQVQQWTAQRGDSLHRVIEAWARRSHVELNWLAEYDYPLQASFSYTGSFEDAVRNILIGFEDAHPQPVAELHNNPTLGIRVLLVQTRGNSNGS